MSKTYKDKIQYLKKHSEYDEDKLKPTRKEKGRRKQNKKQEIDSLLNNEDFIFGL